MKIFIHYISCFILILLALESCYTGNKLKMKGSSMEPTLLDGVAIRALQIKSINRGDIIICRNPRNVEESFVKRVIGLPGDEIEIRNGIVIVNGSELIEPYVLANNRKDESIKPLTIPEGMYYVLGDNRIVSFDSRNWGTLSRDLIIAIVST